MKVLACHIDQSDLKADHDEKSDVESAIVDPAEQCSGCNTNCIERPLRRYFAKHGRYVAKHPYPFLIIPLIFSACFGYGLRYFELEQDTEYLVTPKQGPAKFERRLVQEYFHVEQQGGFLPDRAAVLDGFTDIIIAARDGDNVLTEKHLQSIINLEKSIKAVVATDAAGNQYTFSSVCATWGDACIDHPIFLVLGRNASNVNKITLTYPQHGYIFLGQALGNVTFEGNTSVVAKARSTRLTFFVRYAELHEQAIANLWFDALQAFLLAYEDEHIMVFHSATNSLAQQFDEASADIMPKFAAPFVLLTLFSIFSCMMNDWVLSKPGLALTGVLYAGLSLTSAFGLLSAIGIKAVPQVGLVPFLTLGVGVDNMFILISAWRRTDTDGLLGLPMKKRVEIRMGEAMKEAALSITITSLTNVLAFCIGAITDFPTVELFCLYTGLSMGFSYIYCISFFSAALVFCGWREEANRHCFSGVKVLAKKEAKDRSSWYRIFCAGGKPGRCTQDDDIKTTRADNFLPLSSADLAAHNEQSDHVMMTFFKQHFGPWLMKPWVKVIVIICYLTYLSGAIYGCIHMRRGVSFEKLSNIDSYLQHYYQNLNHYFNQFGPNVQLIVTDELDYSLPETQERVERVIETFTNRTEYFYAPATQSWLRDMNMYLDMMPRLPETSQDWMDTLKYQFLKMRGFDRHQLDITFNEDDTKIRACRFYIQSRWYEKTEDMMEAARRIAEGITELNVTVFHQTFVYFDQPIVVWANTLQNIVIAVICMFFVALLFVPHPLSALWVTLATASIECGVIGYMTLWDVNVDFISMTYLILCIGFSVDFSVHITYGFISSEEKTGSAKAIDALYTLGYPVLQSGTSTILGVIFLCLSISYLFLSFFKTMLLVVLFGAWHALFILPVVLSMFGGDNCQSSCEEDCTCPSDCQCPEEVKEQLSQSSKQIFHLFTHCDECVTTPNTSDFATNGDPLVISDKCTVV